MKRTGIVALLACVIAPGASANPQTLVTVSLGVHRFGHTRPPGAIVARVAADQVGWQLEGDDSGPETFLVGSDASIWLHDEVNHRLLVWTAGRPDAVARTVTQLASSPRTGVKIERYSLAP